MKVNHIDDADLKTLREINKRLYDETRWKLDEQRDLANLMWLILGRVGEIELEHEDG